MNIKNLVFVSIIIFSSIIILPANAQTIATGDNCTQSGTGEVIAVAAVIKAGTIQDGFSIMNCDNVRSTSDTVYWRGYFSGPVILGVLGLVNTWQIPVISGCTATTPVVSIDQIAAATHLAAYGSFTMTSAQCSGIAFLDINVLVGGTSSYRYREYFAFNFGLRGVQPNFVLNCGASGTTDAAYSITGTSCLNPQIDNIDRISNAATWGATPQTLQINNLNYWCDATLAVPNSFNPATTTCNRPTFTMNIGTGTLTLSGTINVVNSGTQHIIIDSWPSLTAAVTNSGTINIQNTAGQTFAISGTMNNVLSGTINTVESGTVAVTLPSGINVAVTSWPQLQAVLSGRLDNFNFICNATGLTPGVYNAATQICNQLQLTAVLSGTLTVAGTINVVNSGGQAISISSWPSLTAALSGNVGITFNNVLTIHQDPLSGTVSVVNSGGQSISITSWPQLQAVLSGDINIHQDQACGATITCKSSVNSTLVMNGNVTNNQSTSVQLTLLPYYLLLIAVAFFAVFADLRNDGLYWFIDLILSIYLLIIRPDNSVIPRAIFLGWIFVVAYQAIALLSNKRAKNLSGEAD